MIWFLEALQEFSAPGVKSWRILLSPGEEKGKGSCLSPKETSQTKILPCLLPAPNKLGFDFWILYNPFLAEKNEIKSAQRESQRGQINWFYTANSPQWNRGDHQCLRTNHGISWVGRHPQGSAKPSPKVLNKPHSQSQRLRRTQWVPQGSLTVKKFMVRDKN